MEGGLCFAVLRLIMQDPYYGGSRSWFGIFVSCCVWMYRGRQGLGGKMEWRIGVQIGIHVLVLALLFCSRIVMMCDSA